MKTVITIFLFVTIVPVSLLAMDTAMPQAADAQKKVAEQQAQTKTAAAVPASTPGVTVDVLGLLRVEAQARVHNYIGVVKQLQRTSDTTFFTEEELKHMAQGSQPFARVRVLRNCLADELHQQHRDYNELDGATLKEVFEAHHLTGHYLRVAGVQDPTAHAVEQLTAQVQQLAAKVDAQAAAVALHAVSAGAGAQTFATTTGLASTMGGVGMYKDDGSEGRGVGKDKKKPKSGGWWGMIGNLLDSAFPSSANKKRLGRTQALATGADTSEPR